MRTGWNPELARLLQRPDPVARAMVEAVVTTAEDVRSRKEEWDAADSLTGLETLASGGVRLAAGAAQQHASQTTRDSAIADLDRSEPYAAARLVWPANADPETTVQRVRVWLHPNLDGQGQEVAHWKCELHALVKWGRIEASGFPSLQLAKIAEAIVAAGPAEGEVLFSFAGDQAPRPASIWPQDIGRVHIPEAYDHTRPVTFVFIYALGPDGSPVGNAGWARRDTNPNPQQTSGILLHGAVLQDAPSQHRPLTLADTAEVPWVPYVIVESSDYQAATVAFTGPNAIDLGQPPAADEVVELVAHGETPGSSAITWEVLADDGMNWVPFVDGQLTDELAGVSRRQTYEVRAHLAPSALGDLTPIARDLGARLLRRWVLDGLATARVTNGWAVDPRELRGSIPEVEIDVIRDGVRDFRDFAALLASEHNPADLEFRLWVGHPTRLPRSAWLLIDTFLIDDIDPRSGRLTFVCVSPLARTRVRLPPYDEIAQERTVLTYSNESLADVYQDLLTARIALPERYRGAGVPDHVTLVSREIRDDDGKELLDAIAYLAGGTLISSQGRIKFRPMHGSGAPVAVFPAEEIRQPAAPPGLRDRVPEFFVPFDWSDLQREFRSEVRSFHAAALAKMGLARIDAPDRLDANIARWIFDPAHAREVARRVTDTLGTGLILWSFRSIYPHPYLEPGDIVLVESRQFIGRDPNTDAALRGVLWARAVVVEVRDALGTDFVVWVRGYADLLSTTQVLDLIGFTAPSVTPTLDQDGGQLYLHPHRNEHCEAVRWVVDTQDEPTLTEVRAGQLSTLDRIPVHTFQGLPVERVWVGVLPLQRADGSGDEGALVTLPYTASGFAGFGPAVTWFRVAATSPAAEAVRLVVSDDGDQVALFYRTYPKGGVPPAFTRVPSSGFQADPLTHDVQVLTPAVGDPPIVLEAYAQDDDGLTTPRRVVIEFDHGAAPDADFQLDVDVDGRVWLVINSTDPDTGSARARLVVGAINVDAFAALTYVDDADPGDGVIELARARSQFGQRIDTGLVLGHRQAVYLVGRGFRTTSTLPAAQVTSRSSDEVRAWKGTGLAPGGSVTPDDYREQPALRCQFNEAVIEIVVTVPGGKTKTFSGLAGGGVVTYQVGITQLDDATIEAPLGEDEARGPYRVEYSDGRSTVVMYDGRLHGPVGTGVVGGVHIVDAQWVIDGINEFHLQVTATFGAGVRSLLVQWSKLPEGEDQQYEAHSYGQELGISEEAAGSATFFVADEGTGVVHTFLAGDRDISLTLTPFDGDLDAAGLPTGNQNGAAAARVFVAVGETVAGRTGAMKLRDPSTGLVTAGPAVSPGPGLQASVAGSDPTLRFDPTIIDVVSDPARVIVQKLLQVGSDPNLAFGALLRGRYNHASAANAYAAYIEFHQTAAADGFTVGPLGATAISGHSAGKVTTLSGIQAVAQHLGAGLVGNLRGIDARAVGTGPVDHATAVFANNPGTSQTTNAYAFYAQAITQGVNRFGLFIEDVAGGTVNEAIRTHAGLVSFGDTVDIRVGALKLGGVTVVHTDRRLEVPAAHLIGEEPNAIPLFVRAAAGQAAALARFEGETGPAFTVSPVGELSVAGRILLGTNSYILARGGRGVFDGSGWHETALISAGVYYSGTNDPKDNMRYLAGAGISGMGGSMLMVRANGFAANRGFYFFTAPDSFGVDQPAPMTLRMVLREATLNVHVNVVPDATNTRDLGSGTLRFRDLYLSGSANIAGPLLAADGVAAAPGIAFAADPNTGIYRAGEDRLVLAAAGGPQLEANQFHLLAFNHLRPNVDATIDLGSNTLRFRDLYLAGAARLNVGTTMGLEWYSSGVLRWRLFSTVDPANDMALNRFADDGSFGGVMMSITRTGTDPIHIHVGGQLRQVTAGAPDSGGTGFRLLRVPN